MSVELVSARRQVEYHNGKLIIPLLQSRYQIDPDSCMRMWNAGSDFARSLEKDTNKYVALGGDIFESVENPDVLIVVHGGSAYEIYKPRLEPIKE